MCSEYLNPPTCVHKYLTNRNTFEIAVLMTDEHLSAVLPTATSTHTEWRKIPSVHSVGHCEGRGGRRRVGLGSKGAGSWEVPVSRYNTPQS